MRPLVEPHDGGAAAEELRRIREQYREQYNVGGTAIAGTGYVIIG